MPELRRSSLKQLKRLTADIKRQGGDIESKRNKKEDSFANLYWNHNPIDAHNSGKRRISTYEDHAKIDIPDAPHLKEHQKNNTPVMLVKKLRLNENGPNDTPQEIMANMKTIANWHPDKNYNAQREMNINTAGKYVEIGTERGYINRIEGLKVFVALIDTGEIKEFTLKDAIKGYKVAKEKEATLKGQLNLTGPGISGTAPQAQSGHVGAKLDAKATVAPDQKLATKIYTTGDYKKLDNSSLTPDLEGGKMSPSKTVLTPVVAKDQAITTHNTSVKKIGEYDANLATEPEAHKTVKGKHNTIAPVIDATAASKEEQAIFKKNNKVKKLGEIDTLDSLAPKIDTKVMKAPVKPLSPEIDGAAKSQVEQKLLHQNTTVKKLEL